MGLMIIKMTAVTVCMIVLTVMMWHIFGRKEITPARRIVIGLIFGAAAVLSTHFGVDYDNMVLSVRDMAPLAAGLFFDPVSGVIAGMIGGIERFIAGTYFGFGSYTRIACSLSTIVAGFIGVIFSIKMFRHKKTTPIYALFIGALMEVFHMYSIFITHREDMKMAFYVVDTASVPMIVFTALGLFVSSLLIEIISGRFKNRLKRRDSSEVPISSKFQVWLLVATMIMLTLTFAISYLIHTNSVLQDAQHTMKITAEDAKAAYNNTKKTYSSVIELIKGQALLTTHGIVDEINDNGGVEAVQTDLLSTQKNLYELYEVTTVSNDGTIINSTETDLKGKNISSIERFKQFNEIITGEKNTMVQDYTNSELSKNVSVLYAGAPAKGGMVLIGVDDEDIEKFSVEPALEAALGSRHVGESGNVFISDQDNVIIAGNLKGLPLSVIGPDKDQISIKNGYFTTDIADKKMYCRFERLDDGFSILVMLPYEEIYMSRKVFAYETAFADVLLFTLVFILIYILVQLLIVKNLDAINNSLKKITGGNLDEVVSVKASKEFTSLSNDINQTVDTLKDYIDQAEKKIEEELEFARAIQAAALPRIFESPGRNEFELYALMHPAKEVGGDFYDFFFVGKNKLALVIADVSGKGIPASLFMMRSKATVKNLAETGISPANIMKRANKALAEGNDACIFVTVWIGILNLETGVLDCANAGHEYPVIKRRDGSFELFKDKHDSMLALFEEMKYSEYRLQLQTGDKLFVYTDGVPEAINSAEEQYGTDRMVEALNKTKNSSVRDILHSVREDISDFVGNADQFDDITMLALEYKKNSVVAVSNNNDANELHIDAKLSNMNTVNEFLHQQLENHHCSDKTLMQIEISVEEIFTNICNYAYDEEGGMARILISVDDDKKKVTLTFIDSGKPYNPLLKKDPDFNVPIEKKEIGGLGIYLVLHIMDEVGYEYSGGENIFTVVKYF